MPISPTGFLSSAGGGLSGAASAGLGNLGTVGGVNLGDLVGGLTFSNDGQTLFALTDGNVAVVNMSIDGQMAGIMSVNFSNGNDHANLVGNTSSVAASLTSLATKYLGSAASKIPGVSSVSGYFNSAAAGPVLIAGFQSSSNVLYQMQYGLDDTVYIQEFGDAVDTFTVSGTALTANCNGLSVNTNIGGFNIGASLKAGNPPGATRVLNFYGRSRLKTNDQGELPKTTISLFDGSVACEGYVVGMTLGITDPVTLAVPFQLSMIGRLNLPNPMGQIGTGTTINDLVAGATSAVSKAFGF